MFKIIKLTQNKQTIVDDDDFNELNKYKWCAHYIKKNNSYYAVRTKSIKGKKKTIRIHRFIMCCPDSLIIDHINHNTLDNRKKNLRICTISDNVRNRNKTKTKNISKFKGVYFHKRDKKWCAQIVFNYKKFHLGCFENEKNAAMAYNEAAKKYFGEYARLNKN